MKFKQKLRKFTTRTAKSVETSLSDEEAIKICREMKDNNFAQNLGKQYLERKSLSKEQWAWVHVLAFNANKPAPPKEVIQIIASGIIDLFDAASTKLKYPKIHLKAGDQNLKFNRAGERARHPGSINISDGGGYGMSIFFGRIHLDGRFEPSRNCPADIKEFIIAFAEDPVSIASAYGHKTGNCCFCMKSLTDNRSIEVGYGPICAKHYQLPWGEND